MNAKMWQTIITVSVPVVSAVVVALITRDTNLRLARLEESARQASLKLEQQKLAEQRDARLEAAAMQREKKRDDDQRRRQAFLEAHLPKILSNNNVEASLGTSLLILVYQEEADDILKKIGKQSSALTTARTEASRLRSVAGNWGIVISGDRKLGPATTWAANLKDEYSPVRIYKKEAFYRVVIGNYDSRQVAEEAAISARVITRADAYAVPLGTWCRNAAPGIENGVEVYSCAAGGLN